MSRRPYCANRQQNSSKRRRIATLVRLLLLGALLWATVVPALPLPLYAQPPTPTSAAPPSTSAVTATVGAEDGEDALLAARVESILAQMSPADRVGQLFLISFQGSATDFESDIVELIHGYRVGGVALSPKNGNFSNEKGIDTPRQVADLANRLQAIAYGLLVPEGAALDPMPIAPWPPRDLTYLPGVTGVAPSNLPLFVAVQQGGDDLPSTALRRGFTPLPSQMALGAAWNPDLTTQVGTVVGRELSAVGINTLLGPVLDVFDQPNIDAVGSLALDAFGGDPYWVSRMGRAYIEGVHTGSNGRVATVARHFPGQGNTDRLPEEEVATIQRSQAEMRRIALPPFLSVTRQPSSILQTGGDPGATDMIMTSQMRYSGLQGAGRVLPLGLAPELRTILQQEGFSTWRDQGGVIVSNSLGAPAIRRFYGDSAPDFYNRRVALDAFLAGNDLLFLDDFSLDGRWDTQKANIKETIGFFQDRYNNDPDFAAQVDAAVRRILRLKLGLYRDILHLEQSGAQLAPLSNVMVNESDLAVLSGEPRTSAETLIGQVARGAVTILYPDPALQTDPLPPSFRADDRILIISDSRLLRECATCTTETAIGPDEIADTIKRLYGSEATGQIDPELVVSLTFADLTQFLDSRQIAPAPAALVTATATLTATAPVTGTPSPIDVARTITSILALANLAPDLELFGMPAQDKNEKTAELIENADWIIFAMLDVAPLRAPNSNAVSRFLREYGDELGDQRLVVLALNAPYFLDATEMSRLTTYFGVYSKIDPFLESSVRALFRSYTASGAPPVSVPGTRFASLTERLAPDASRTIPLQAQDAGGAILAQNGATAVENDNSNLRSGDTLRVVAGPVLDMNGNTVPDGTPVIFRLQFDGDDLALAVEPALSQTGVAVREIVLDRGGVLRVSATSGAATSGEPIALNVVAAPVAPQAEEGSGAEAANAALAPRDRTTVLTLLIALFTILVTLSLFLIVQVRVLPRVALVHNLLWAAIFGLAGYLLYGVGLFPGGTWLNENVGVWGATAVVFVPMLLPLLWLQLRGEGK
ncbi:MAG: hypothetical protein KAX65_04390 [Caldilineaceae bacterium]|nr:hypothetical protein [Caldilineaceae bacterium]